MTNAGSRVPPANRHPELLALRSPLGADAYAHRRGARPAGQAPAAQGGGRRAPAYTGGWPVSRGLAGRPSHRHRLLFGRYPAVTLFHRAFYRGLTPPCLEGYDPVQLAVISFRTRRK